MREPQGTKATRASLAGLWRGQGRERGEGGGGGGRAGRGAHQHPTNLDNLNLGRDRAARASPGLGVKVALRAVASHFAVELKLSRIATALATKRPRAIAKTSVPSQHEGVAATVFW